MCKIVVDETASPDFVLYNLVFGGNALSRIDVDQLSACMCAYGVEMDRGHVRLRLRDWYDSGLLRIRGGDYVVAS